MFHKRFLCLLTLLACMAGVGMGAAALEVDCDSTYCFGVSDFSEQALSGICITGLPSPSVGTVTLGSRVLRCGDILTADQIAQMTFCPLLTEQDAEAQVTFLPIYENRVEKATAMTISIRGKQDKAPVAEDSSMETYKNLANDGRLKVTDPEGKALTFTLTRKPKRGEVEIREDGSFTYTPKKNKVGVDSFTYTATDPAGNVSRVATVTVQIMKPGDSTQYTDTTESSCRFAAEWMKNTGLYIGECIGGNLCFNEHKEVSQGEFMTMLMKTLDIPTEGEQVFLGSAEGVPQWLKPYLAAALRSGLTAGLPVDFGTGKTITGAEAAVMLQNALDLSISTAVNTEEDNWAVTVMNENGIPMEAAQVLTRGDAANILYRIHCLASVAPGLSIFQ